MSFPGVQNGAAQWPRGAEVCRPLRPAPVEIQSVVLARCPFPFSPSDVAPPRPQRTGGRVDRGWPREPRRCDAARGRPLGRPRPCVAWPREWSVAETWNEQGGPGGNVLRKELDTVARRKFFHFLYSDLEIRGRGPLAIQSRLVPAPSATVKIFRHT